ncbi:MAG: putative nitrogen fixation protein NifT [Magnetospirillum sp.]|nr:putative nitrogen fixation protein NifT [Magnetospirillum sp.]
MKITLRKVGNVFEVYVPKKDLEEKVVSMQNPGLWGGWIALGNGWRFELPAMAPDTPLPLTVEARKLAEDDS